MDLIKKYKPITLKWIIHYVFDAHTDYINCHTHGLTKKYKIPELQIVLPVNRLIAKTILRSVVKDIIEYKIKIEENKNYDSIINNDYIRFKYIQSHWRIILPDPQGLFPDSENCEELYKKQVNITFEEE